MTMSVHAVGAAIYLVDAHSAAEQPTLQDVQAGRATASAFSVDDAAPSSEVQVAQHSSSNDEPGASDAEPGDNDVPDTSSAAVAGDVGCARQAEVLRMLAMYLDLGLGITLEVCKPWSRKAYFMLLCCIMQVWLHYHWHVCCGLAHAWHMRTPTFLCMPLMSSLWFNCCSRLQIIGAPYALLCVQSLQGSNADIAAQLQGLCIKAQARMLEDAAGAQGETTEPSGTKAKSSASQEVATGILEPCDVKVVMKQSEAVQDLNIHVSALQLRMSPDVLQLVLQLQQVREHAVLLLVLQNPPQYTCILLLRARGYLQVLSAASITSFPSISDSLLLLLLLRWSLSLLLCRLQPSHSLVWTSSATSGAAMRVQAAACQPTLLRVLAAWTCWAVTRGSLCGGHSPQQGMPWLEMCFQQVGFLHQPKHYW